MNCDYCGKPVGADGIESGGLLFCNNLCKYLYSKSGSAAVNYLQSIEKNNSQINLKEEDPGMNIREEKSQVFLNNLDFNIELPGMQSGRLLVRAGYFRGPRVFLDEKKLNPVKRQFFRRTKTYHLTNEENILFEIKVKKRLLDAVPDLFINGEKTELAKKLRWFEYIWITIPFLLIFFGTIGFFIGTAAAFTNSILFRKIRKTAVKYTMIVFNTFVALYLFLQIYSAALPYFIDVNFYFQKLYVDSNTDQELIPLVHHRWESYKITDSINKNLTPLYFLEVGSKRYFFQNGSYYLISSQGKVFISAWKLLDEKNAINITAPGVDDTIKIVSLTDTSFIFSYKNLRIINEAD
jgi:hypothetical protein